MNNELEKCWQQLQPSVNALSQAVMLSPCPEDQRYYLALRIVGQFLATGCQMLKAHDPALRDKKVSEIANNIMTVVIPSLDHAAAKAKKQSH